MNKSYVLLLMCEDLKKGKPIRFDECLQKYKISVPTFRRYIAVLRDFFIEELGKEIIYVPTEKCYRVKKQQK
ncbi:MAG: hypothetical protein IKC33_01315 [Clostridia bacterium]|nr:hypothetical protein [Clostridia bacterium]MBQ3495065.1 hypothetical protein [Clostridia bacterium]MBQ4587060.1 hypothetical protein [Clostridia bacterium]MBQ6883560.1 hypothetical protein [Clostridia bacterium]MBR2932933.1 hypothetical protein [Clostridia bacterium]